MEIEYIFCGLFPLLKSIIPSVWKISNIKWFSNQFNAFCSQKTYQNKNDELALSSQYPDGKGTKCIAQFYIWNLLSGN